MTCRVHRLLAEVPHQELSKEEYEEQAWEELKRSKEFLKLECRQHFVEPGNPSWDLFAVGDWAGALQAIDRVEDQLREYLSLLESGSLAARRLRIVQLPVSPYLQWELQLLARWCKRGEDVRVVIADAPESKELTELGELNILDERMCYEALYSDSGELTGAKKYTTTATVATLRTTVENVVNRAEPLLPFFEQRIRNLPPPSRGPATTHMSIH